MVRRLTARPWPVSGWLVGLLLTCGAGCATPGGFLASRNEDRQTVTTARPPLDPADLPSATEPVIRGQSPEGAALPAALFPDNAAPWLAGLRVNPRPAGNRGVVVRGQSPYLTPADPFLTPNPGPIGGPMLGDPLTLPNAAPYWLPYAAALGKFGNDRVMGYGQLMLPLYQDGASMFFADLRGRIDDSGGAEGNFGAGLRSMINPFWIGGINAFYDLKRSPYGNRFNQGGVGIEALSVPFEARLNGYIPESGGKRVDDLNIAELSGSTLFVRAGEERAYYGFDGEVGALLFDNYGGDLELRGFVGGYYFNTSASGFPEVTGPRGRLELRHYDVPILGPESRFTLGVEIQWDQVRETQVAGMLRVEIPFGSGPTRKLTRLERRMLDRIVRDDDIVTVADRGPRETALDPLTHQPLTNLTLVDSQTADVPAAVAAAGPNSIVIADGTNGVIATAGPILVQPGQTFRGAGFGAVGSSSGAVAVYGQRPTIVSMDPNAQVVVVANDSTVADLNVQGGFTGVASLFDPVLLTFADVTGALVSGNRVSDAAVAGFAFGDIDNLTTIADNTATENANLGFLFNDVSGAVADNTASANGAAGFVMAGVTTTGIVQGNTASQNGGNGFLIGNIDGTVEKNVARANLDAGFLMFGNISGTGVVTGNTAADNQGAGLVLIGNVDGSFSDNTASNNHGAGIAVVGDVAGTVTGNVAEGNSDVGLAVIGSVSGMVNQNTARGNAGFGFLFVDVAASGQISGNTAQGNAFAGYEFLGNMDGSVNGNSAAQNQGDGFDFVFSNLTGVVNGNTATSNFGSGFALGTVFGTISGNTASGNRSAGYEFNGNMFGAVKSNTASANRGDGFVFNFGDNFGNFESNVANGNGFLNGVPQVGADGFDFQTNFGVFSNNSATGNADLGYRSAFGNFGAAANNTGSGNLNGGNTFP